MNSPAVSVACMGQVGNEGTPYFCNWMEIIKDRKYGDFGQGVASFPGQWQ
jgi:hypothetical protein